MTLTFYKVTRISLDLTHDLGLIGLPDLMQDSSSAARGNCNMHFHLLEWLLIFL